MQVTKPYASFFNDKYLESMKVIYKDAELDDVDPLDNDNNPAYTIAGDDQGVEDNDYGEGDMGDAGFDDD